MVMFASPFMQDTAPMQASPQIAGGKGGYTGTFQTNPPGGGGLEAGTPLGTLLQQLMGGSGAPVHAGPVPLDVKGGWGTRTNGFPTPNGNMTGSPNSKGVGVPIGQIMPGQTMSTQVMGNGTPAEPITGEKAPTPGALLPDGPTASGNPTLNPSALPTGQSGAAGNNKSPFASCK